MQPIAREIFRYIKDVSPEMARARDLMREFNLSKGHLRVRICQIRGHLGKERGRLVTHRGEGYTWN